MSEELTTTALKEEEFNKKVDMKVWKRLLKEVGKDKKNEDGMLRIVVPIGIGDCDVRPMKMDAFAALF